MEKITDLKLGLFFKFTAKTFRAWKASGDRRQLDRYKALRFFMENEEVINKMIENNVGFKDLFKASDILEKTKG